MRDHDIDDHGLTPSNPAREDLLDAAVCPECQGVGALASGEICPVCEGTGRPTGRAGGG